MLHHPRRTEYNEKKWIVLGYCSLLYTSKFELLGVLSSLGCMGPRRAEGGTTRGTRRGPRRAEWGRGDRKGREKKGWRSKQASKEGGTRETKNARYSTVHVPYSIIQNVHLMSSLLIHFMLCMHIPVYRSPDWLFNTCFFPCTIQPGFRCKTKKYLILTCMNLFLPPSLQKKIFFWGFLVLFC